MMNSDENTITSISLIKQNIQFNVGEFRVAKQRSRITADEAHSIVRMMKKRYNGVLGIKDSSSIFQ